MNCKYCGAELEADAKFCPECGKAQTEEDVPSAETAAPETAAPETEAPAEEAAQAEEAAPQTDEAAEAAPEAKESPTQEAPAEKPEKSEKKKTGWLLGGAIAVLVIVIALLVVKIVRDSQIKNVDTATTEETVADASTDAADPSDTPDDALDSSGDGESTEIPLNGVSYTVAADELTDEVLDRVVAECGDMTLTNRDLPVYYWQQYLSFANTYGMYLSYIMDTTLPLDQQMYDEENTWQQMFLDAGLSMFQYHAAAAQEAEKAGYQLSAESEQTLAELKDSLQSAAESYGFESADAYLQNSFGPSVTVEVYQEFLRRALLGTEYLNSLVDAEQPTDAEISQYYDDNAETYAENRVEKIDKPMVNVRHILIEPEAAEDGTISDEAWAAAEQTANDILDQWLAGDATEESFANMANENSSDPGSNTNGGLYENVYPGQMVETFNDWCFADGRQPGDYGIVKTDYGYHIIFFVGAGDEIYWFQTAKEDYLSDLAVKIQDEITAKYTFVSYVDQAALVDVLTAANDSEAAQ